MDDARDQASGTPAPPGRGPVDIHVHAVGNGSGGSGCWLRVRPWRRPFASLMLRHAGLPQTALSQDLERLYTERLLEMLRHSSLAAVAILAQDLVHDDSGNPRPDLSMFYVPNDYVLRLGREHDQLLPAISIHPARKDALAELDKCLEAGAVMMKLLPNCHNINCNDPRFRPFWKRMAEAGLPLLAHTGGEHTLPITRKEYSDPRILSLPLDCGVKVIAAHCATKSGLSDPEYFYAFVEMTQRYGNFYGDNSAFTVPIRGRRVRDCLQPPLAKRILHGSDLPVPVYGHFPWLRGFLTWQDFRRWQKHRNVLERDYQFKKAMGFAPESFTRAWDLLRVPRRGSSPQ